MVLNCGCGFAGFLNLQEDCGWCNWGCEPQIKTMNTHKRKLLTCRTFGPLRGNSIIVV